MCKKNNECYEKRCKCESACKSSKCGSEEKSDCRCKSRSKSKCNGNNLIDCRKPKDCREKCNRCKAISRRFGIDYECTHTIVSCDRCGKAKKDCRSKCSKSKSKSKSKSRSEESSKCSKSKSKSKSRSCESESKPKDCKCKHHKRCDKKCEKKCEKKCDDCDMKIKIIDDAIMTRSEAVTMVHDTTGIVIPSILFNYDGSVAEEPFLYDFGMKKTLGTVTVVTNNIAVHKITDSTVIDDECCFWILDVSSCKGRDKSRTLIKVCFNECEKTLSFIAQYPIPIEGCGCNDECPEFEGLAIVGKSDFLVFSHDRSEFNGQGILFVTIKNHKAFATTIQLRVCGKIVTPHTYDLYGISTAFYTKNGVIVVPQFPEHHDGSVFKITNREIRRVKREIECADPCKPKCIVIDGCVMKLCIRDECEEKMRYMNNCSDNKRNFVNFATYQGIRAMTSDDCGRIFGLASWVYPYIVLKSEDPVPLPPKGMSREFIQTIEDDVFPEGYDRLRAGFYVKPFIGRFTQ